MITVIVVTKNRSEFIIRLLNYYADTKYKHWIYIGDSSDYFHLEKTRNAVKKIKGRLQVRHYKYKDLIGTMVLKNLADEIMTPYAVYIGDDDFLVTRSLDLGVDFLEKNKDYIGVNGESVSFLLNSAGANGSFCSIGPYKQIGIEEDTAQQRLLTYLQNYFVTLFSVKRTSVWKEMYKENLCALTDSFSTTAFAGELFPCCFSVLQGKIKHLDSLYLFRQMHEKRNHLFDAYDWITSPNWQASYQVFHDCLVQSLIKKDGIQEKNAHEVVKQAFWAYMSKGMTLKFNGRYGKPVLNERIKERIRHMPGVFSVLRRLKMSMSPVSLPSLLNKRSPYHSDFMPVYNIVTKAR